MRRRWILPALAALVVAGCGGGGGGGARDPGAALVASEGASGSQAARFLTAAQYTDLAVEVDAVQGEDPDAPALNLLRTRLGERCNKPGGIVVLAPETITPTGTTTWDLSAIRALELQHRQHFAAGNSAALYILYLDGHYAGDTQSAKVLAVSHTGSSIAVFKETIRGAALGVLFPISSIEQAVLVHEAGHNLGLVNNGVPMVAPHEDASHPAHDSSDQCVMFWAIETDLISQVLSSAPTQFDAACIADLQAAGGK